MFRVRLLFFIDAETPIPIVLETKLNGLLSVVFKLVLHNPIVFEALLLIEVVKDLGGRVFKVIINCDPPNFSPCRNIPDPLIPGKSFNNKRTLSKVGKSIGFFIMTGERIDSTFLLATSFPPSANADSINPSITLIVKIPSVTSCGGINTLTRKKNVCQ